MKKLNYLAIIPAKGVSQRIPGKNLKLLAGKPLILYTIKAAQNAKKIDRIIVSTDDKKIASYSQLLGLKVPFLRPKKYARATSPVLETILYTVEEIERENIKIENIVLLQPTSPFRTAGQIDKAIKNFEKSKSDTLTSVCDCKEHPYYALKLKNNFLVPLSRKYFAVERNKLPPMLIENGAIIIFKRALLKLPKIYGKNIMPYIMDEQSSLDIDTMADWDYAQYLLDKK